MTRRTLGVAAGVCLVLAACSWKGDSTATTVESSTAASTAAPTTASPSTPTAGATTAPTTPAPTGAPTTTTPTTVAPTTAVPTTVPTSSTPPTSATGTCAAAYGTATVNAGFPARMSSLVGRDVRTGQQPCVDRLVIELQPGTAPVSTAFPGYQVAFATGPVTKSPSGEPADVKGAAVLLVSLGSWMQNMSGEGYSGPTDLRPTNTTAIEQVLLTENYEGQSQWAVGLDAKRPFRAYVLDGPPRLVVDIRTSG